MAVAQLGPCRSACPSCHIVTCSSPGPQVEERSRQSEADKAAVLHQLQRQSEELLHIKHEKQRLEEVIKGMQSHLLTGGNKIEDTPAFRWGRSASRREGAPCPL